MIKMTVDNRLVEKQGIEIGPDIYCEWYQNKGKVHLLLMSY